MNSETVLSGGRLDSTRNGISEPDTGRVVVDDARTVEFVGLRHDSIWRISDTHLFKAGVDFRRLSGHYDYSSLVQDEPDESRLVQLAPNGTSLGAYAARNKAA